MPDAADLIREAATHLECAAVHLRAAAEHSDNGKAQIAVRFARDESQKADGSLRRLQRALAGLGF